MRAILSFVLLALAIVAVPPAAKAKTCSPGRASVVTIERLKANPSLFDRKCVTVRGILFGGYVFIDRRALSEARADPSISKRSIVAGVPPSRRAIRAAVTGELIDCAAAQRRVEAKREEDLARGVIVMLTGFCHSSSDMNLNNSTVQTLSTKPIVRLTDAEVPPAERAIIEAAPNAPGRDGHVAAARAMLERLANGDRTVAKNLEPDGAQQATARLQGIARTIVTDPSAKMKIFVLPFPIFPDVMEIEIGWTCWCALSDCTGRWPVEPGSVDNLPGRPYLCVVTTSDSGKYSATIPSFDEGLAEPID